MTINLNEVNEMVVNTADVIKKVSTKVVDIEEAEFYHHSFVRYGVSLEGKGGRYGPVVDYSVDRLTQIFQNGLVSGDFARRANISVGGNFGNPMNDKYVSLMQKRKGTDATGTDIILRPFSVGRKIDPPTLYKILIDPSINTEDVDTEMKGATAKKHRISPRNFCGIVLYPPSWNKEDLHLALNEVVSAMQSVYGNHPDHYIPIYDRQGNLVWPEEVRRDRIKDWRESKLNEL